VIVVGATAATATNYYQDALASYTDAGGIPITVYLNPGTFTTPGVDLVAPYVETLGTAHRRSPYRRSPYRRTRSRYAGSFPADVQGAVLAHRPLAALGRATVGVPRYLVWFGPGYVAHALWLVALDETWHLDDDLQGIVAVVGFGLLLAALVVLWHAAPRSRGRRPLLAQDAPQPPVDGAVDAHDVVAGQPDLVRDAAGGFEPGGARQSRRVECLHRAQLRQRLHATDDRPPGGGPVSSDIKMMRTAHPRGRRRRTPARPPPPTIRTSDP